MHYHIRSRVAGFLMVIA
uniref:Uncharacterized protein n=1 Tax=Zea mays TaxID=4577 RepID=B4FMZ3_MAIZE|nr:unknown [Zea mays]